MDNARRFRKTLLVATKAILILSLGIILLWFWWEKYRDVATYYSGGNYLVVFLYLVLLLVFSGLYGATRIGVFRLGEVIYSLFITLIVANAITYIIFCLIARSLLMPVWILLATTIQFVVGILFLWGINKLYFRLYPPREMAVIYSDKPKARALIAKMSLRGERYRVCIALSDKEEEKTILAAINQYSAVTLCNINPYLEDKIFTYCNRKGIRVYILPTIQDISIRYSNTTLLFDTPLFYCKNSGPAVEELIFKRMIDIFVSAVGLIVLSPLLLLTAIAVKLYDGGPIIYRQERFTRNRKVFSLYKFRSMRVDAEKKGGAQLSTQNDDRITLVGRVIRTLRFDELPQLINILKGDMSLVGPRPERPEIAKEYEEHLPDFALRLQMKAGLTGYAQVHGNYSTAVSDKLLLDMMYIENYSLLMDFNILFMTLKIIFMREAAAGIEEGAVLPADMEENKRKDKKPKNNKR